jgi:DNA processing protein
MSPVAGLRPDPGNPVHRPVAPAAVPDPAAELSLQVALRLEQLHPQALRRKHGGAVVGEAGGVELLDEAVGVPRVLGNGVDSAFEDVAFPPVYRPHSAIVGCRTRCLWEGARPGLRVLTPRCVQIGWTRRRGPVQLSLGDANIRSMTKAATREQLELLALCRPHGMSWSLVAREAQRPGGLKRLLAGELTERTKETTEMRVLLRRAVSRLPQLIEEASEAVETARGVGAGLTTVLDANYPLNLRSVFNLPPFLFFRGDLRAEDTQAVAVVGTRHPSPAGLKLAHQMAAGLSTRGVTVLSGLAAGIDAVAHRSTLDAGGRTVAVIGTGIRRHYPPENAELAEEIAERGALVSQFWPDAPPTKWSFPLRNVVTSGMGQGTVVIEASSTSGAKMQARLALEHNKLVFLPRSLVDEHPWAQRYAQRPGAFVVDSIDDILRRFQSREVIEHRAEQREQLSLSLA